MRRNSTFGMALYFTLSTVFHCSAAVVLIAVPQLELLDEGSPETIEFVAAEMPQGEQMHTPPQPTSVATVETEKTTPAEALKVPTAEAKPVEPIKASPVVPKKPKKVEVRKAVPVVPPASPEPSPVAEVEPATIPVVAETTPETDSSPIVEPTPVAEPVADTETTPPLADPTPVTELAPVEPVEATETEPAAADEVPVVTETPEEPSSAEAAPGEAEEVEVSEIKEQAAAVATASGPALAASSEEAFGKPDGSARSYTDLQQKPGNRPPQYPVMARRQNQQGQVQLTYYVKGDGSISELKLLKSSGYPALDQEAVRAVSLYRYQPGQEGWTIHPVNFELQGPVKKMPSRLRTSSR
jgi:protein TonB